MRVSRVRLRGIVVVAVLVAVGVASVARGEDHAASPPAPRPGAEATPDDQAAPRGRAAAEVADVVDDVSVDAVCEAAVQVAMADPERARGFVSRARLAGWLPEFHFRVYRRFARTEGLSFDDAAARTIAPVDISAIDDVRYEWRASWDLSRMVFNPDELQAHSEALRMSDVRREIQSLVIRLYFERRRLVIEGQRPTKGADADGGQRRTTRISEIEAQLDALSGGAFSARPAGKREAAATP